MATFNDVITISSLPDSMRVIYSKVLAYTATPSLLYSQFAEEKDDFKGERGDEVVWTVYRQLPPKFKPLQENVDVGGNKLQDFQVRFRIDEYGDSTGTTEKINMLSYHGKISDIVRNLLAPQMALSVEFLARNTLFATRNAALGLGTSYKFFAGSATARSGLAAENTITEAIIKGSGHRLAARRVPPMGSGYVCVTHPDVTYDLRNLSGWVNAQYYAGTDRIFTGETGMIHGVRFVEADMARLPNAGAQIAQTTLTQDTAVGDTHIHVTSTAGLAKDQEISLFPAANATPDGTDESEEPVVISSVDADNSVVYLRAGLMIPHTTGDKVREALDIYPLMFFGNQSFLGKGMVTPPEVRVAPKFDKLGRINYIGWYLLGGFGVLREWAYEITEVTASVSGAPAFAW